MTRALARIAPAPLHDIVRNVIVTGCALALILAGRSLPLF